MALVHSLLVQHVRTHFSQECIKNPCLKFFLTSHEEIRIKLFMMARSNRWKNNFLVHFHVWWPMELPFAIDHVMVTIYHTICGFMPPPPNLYLLLEQCEYLSTYACPACPSTALSSSHPWSLGEYHPLSVSRSCGTPSCWSNHSIAVNLFHGQVIK